MGAPRRPLLRRGPSGPLADPERGIVQVGYDQPIQEFIIPPASVAKFPRDIAGNPLKVVLPDLTPGNTLEIDWRATLQAALDDTYATTFQFYALAGVTFDGSEPTVPSATTFFVLNSYGGSEFADPVGEGGNIADIQSMTGLAAIQIPVGATTATVELFYNSSGDVIVQGTNLPPDLDVSGLAATLKVTELAVEITSQLGPGNLVPTT